MDKVRRESGFFVMLPGGGREAKIYKFSPSPASFPAAAATVTRARRAAAAAAAAAAMCVDWRPRPLLWRRRVLPQPVVLPPVFAHFGDGGGGAPGMLDATAEIWGRGKGGSETLELPRICSSSGKEERFQRVVSLLLAQRLIKNHKKSYKIHIATTVTLQRFSLFRTHAPLLFLFLSLEILVFSSSSFESWAALSGGLGRGRTGAASVIAPR